MSKKGIASCTLMTGVALVLAGSAAQAQEKSAPQATGTANGASDDIIVTASRRAARLQDTALAVNAVNAAQLQAANITDTQSLQTAIPALNFSTSAGASFVFLRGIGSNVFGTFSDNSVATYVDGVYIPRPTAAVQELFDIDRVEVLRGPQATLYGRNATGGAILITTAAPTDTWTGQGDAQFGNYDSRRYRAVLSGPLAGETLAARVSAVRHVHDGYATNLRDGSGLDDQDYWGVRGTLQLKPTAKLTIALEGFYSKESGDPGFSKSADPNSLPFRAPPFGLGTPFSADPRSSYHDLTDSNPTRSYGVNLRASWDIGGATLASNTAYDRYKIGPTLLDLDDSIAPLLEYRGQTGDTKFFYQDLTLTSSGLGPWEWMLGGTYGHEQTETFLPVVTPGGASSTLASTRVNSYAAYAQLGYALSHQLKLVGGLRYSTETRSGVTTQTFGPSAVTNTNRKTWTDISPKVSLEYRPIRDTLIYASVTKGFKSGAFDPINVTSAARPETIWNYEAGLRSQLLDRRLTLNLTAFHYDYRDLQVFNGVINGALVQSFLQNAGKARITGLELEASMRVAHGLNIGGNLALLYGRYGKGTVLADLANAVPGFPPANATVPFSDVGGNHMAQSPTATASIYADWTFTLGNAGTLEFYADYFHQSSRYFTAFEDPTLRAGGYGSGNLRATYTLPDGHFYVSGFVRNVGDTLIISQMTRTPPFGTLVSYQAPRTYGFEAGFKF